MTIAEAWEKAKVGDKIVNLSNDKLTVMKQGTIGATFGIGAPISIELAISNEWSVINNRDLPKKIVLEKCCIKNDFNCDVLVLEIKDYKTVKKIIQHEIPIIGRLPAKITIEWEWE